jgi:hypothetical protein
MMQRARVTLAVFIALAATWPSAAFPRKGEDRREVEARTLFAKADYQAALDIYASLFAERKDPIYLRNVGRCYQKLEQPEKAISSFREYLRRGHVKPAEQSEVEGYIQEMEELQKKRAATTPPAAEPTRVAALQPPPSGAAATLAPSSLASDSPTPVASSEAPGAVLTQQASTEPPKEQRSIATRWWFWTGLAVLVAGGVAAGYVVTHPQPGLKPDCTAMFCSDRP